MTRRRNRVKILAAVLAAAMVLSLVAASITSFAATATVSGTNVNVRESASTGSSVVGTANTGDTFSVSDPVTASDGSKWYKVTLSNGNSGYIRSDLLSVTEDPEPATSQAEPAQTEPEPTQTEPEPAQPEPAASEKYQLVNVPDASGNDVWYVYDYEEGLRIKVEDLSQYDTIKSDADKFEKNANRYRTLLIIFAILLVALLVALALLILRLRDLMSNDVDIAEARRRERARGGAARGATRADGARSAGAAGTESAAGARAGRAGRAYPSRPAGAQGARPVSGAQSAARPAAGERSALRPGARPAQAASREAVRPRTQGDLQRRPAAAQRPAGAPEQARRPQAEEALRTERPVRKPAAPRNFAVDDDMDYGFLKSKD